MTISHDHSAAVAQSTIGDVRVTPILISDPPLLNAQGVHQPYTARTVIEVETTAGVVGLGETYGHRDYLHLAQTLGRQLIGRPVPIPNELAALSGPHAGTSLSSRVGHGLGAALGSGDLGSGALDAGLPGSRRAGKLISSIASAFEVALWDALGQKLGLPVHALLGGRVRDRVDYSAYLFYRWAEHPTAADAGPGVALPADDWGAAIDPDGVVRQARRFAEDYGFRSFKLKGGAFPPEKEIAAVRALAEEFPDRPLRLDPNGAWSVDTSVKVATELADTLEYLEDPTLGTPGMAEVRRRTGVTLATNMCVTTFADIPEAFATDAVQVMLSDHHYWGGLLASRDLAAVCRTFGVGLSMHSNTHLGISLAAMTHLGATIPDLAYACDTHRPWQTEDVITTPHKFVDGALEVSDAPGLGVRLEPDALDRLHQRWLDADPRYRDRDDVAAMRIADPDWTKPTFPRW